MQPDFMCYISDILSVTKNKNKRIIATSMSYKATKI